MTYIAYDVCHEISSLSLLVGIMFALIAFPVFAQRGLRDIPIGARLARHLAQIMPEVICTGTAPEPVAVIDAVDEQTGFQDKGMRDHGIMMRVGIFLDLQILLHFAPRVRKKCPLRAD